MMRDRRYGGNSRLRSPSPRQRRLSPPSLRFRDRGYSTPRHRDCMDTEEERRGGNYPRRDYDRRYERGDRDYERNYDSGDRDYERNYERGGRDHERNSDRGDRRYDRIFDYGGARISNFESGDRDRYRDGDADAGAGRSQSMYRSSIYQSTSDAGYSGRVFKYAEGLSQGDSTSAKFQWDHLLYEPKKSDGFKGSIHHGTGGSGIRTELDHGYQRSKYFDEGSTGFALDSKTASMEAERGRNYSSLSYQMDLGVLPKSSSQVDAVGGFISVPSHFSNSSLHKDEDFHFHDKPHLDKLVADGPLVGDQLAREANSLRYSRADIHFMASSSRSKAFDAVPHGSFKEDVPGSLIPSDGVKFSGSMSTNYFGYDDYGAKSRTRSPVDCGGGLDDFNSYSRSYVDAAEERSSNFSYPEVGRSERSAMVTGPLESHGKMEGVGEHYGHQDMSRVGRLDTNNDKLNGSSHQEYLRGNRLWDPPPTSLGQSTSNYYDANELSYAKRQDLHDQDFGSPRPVYEREVYRGHGSSILGELHHDYEAAGSSWSPKKRADGLSPREYDPSLGNVDGRPQQELLLDDIRFPRPSKKMSRRRYDTEKQANKHGNMVYDIGGAGESWRDDMDSNTLPKKLKVTNSKNGKTRKISSTMALQRPSRSIPVSVPSYSGHRFGTRDIKKRLGPGPQKAHISQRLTQKFKPSLKKRLGPGPQKSHFTILPWMKNLKAPKLSRIEDASDGSHLDQGKEPQEDIVTPSKPEPPEKSEEFRQMVFSAFFKFVKQLNETPAKRKKYKEQGKAGSLKCIVCGSSSEEFEDTESLATHAFTSQKVGVRSQHLGFHKALCALMGWKSAEAVNSVWICETLSHTENLCIKEDLILWPPVVIVQNSTITSQNPDQRVIVTLEKLQARLRDMGFGDKMKVHRGKPANQSIMVVQFGGTLSGLLEAERLHKMYSETKHGRAEFQQLKSCNDVSHSWETKETSVNDADNILYGYLGTAEDLEKLDFDMKKRCVVKSKKDIQNIAEAPLKTQ